MNLRDLIARARATLEQHTVHTPTATDAVIHDRFDEMDYSFVREAVPAIDTAIKASNKHFDYVEDFYQDMFNSLHQGDPMLRETDELREGHRPHVAMSDEFLKSPEFQGLRLSTMHDDYATALALVSMRDEIDNAFKRASEARAAAAEAEKQREELQQALQNLAQAIQAAEADPTDEGAQGALVEAMGAVDPTALQAAQAMAQQAAQEAAQQAGLAMAAKAKQIDESLKETEALCTAYGVEDGELKRMSFDERNRLADQLRNNRLARFSKLLGQFRTLQAAESRRKVEHAPAEIVGVTLGNDLTRLTSGEMVNLAAPETEDDFWRRYADGTLQQYKLEGTEKVGRGPVIVVCDESGSMDASDVAGGTREAWSKALALALCEQARQGKRDFIYIGFSSANQQHRVDFPGGKTTVSKIIEFTEHFYCGGTHYEKPLRQAGEIVLEYAQQKKPKPDIVFITDDEYGSMSPEFMEWWTEVKHKTSMRVFGVAIGCGTSGAMDQVSDNVRKITEMMSDPNTTADMFRTI